MNLVFATNNEHKIDEVKKILPTNIKIFSMKEVGLSADIEENGTTLEENAAIKSKFVFDKIGRDCFADDTGLEVDVLNGLPGVISARYAGVAHDSEANINKLLHNLRGENNRKARFRTVICLILNGKQYHFEGQIEGEILLCKSGFGGFGYDPIFIPSGFDKSFAELSADEKNAISHRGRAIRSMCEFLITN